MKCNDYNCSERKLHIIIYKLNYKLNSCYISNITYTISEKLNEISMLPEFAGFRGVSIYVYWPGSGAACVLSVPRTTQKLFVWLEAFNLPEKPVDVLFYFSMFYLQSTIYKQCIFYDKMTSYKFQS